MRVTRLHVAQPLVPGARIALPAEAAAYLARVLRLQVGDACSRRTRTRCAAAASGRATRAPGPSAASTWIRVRRTPSPRRSPRA